MKIDGNNHSVSPRFVYFGGDDVTVNNVEFVNMPTIALRLDGDNTEVSQCTFRNVYQGGGVGGIAADDGYKNIKIINNLFTGSATSWEGWDINQGSVLGTVEFFGNTIQGFNNQLLDIAISNPKVIGNTFIFDLNDDERTQGVYIGGSINDTAEVLSNTFVNINGEDIGVYTSSYNILNKISGNTFGGNGTGTGMRIYGDQGNIGKNTFINLDIGIDNNLVDGKTVSIGFNQYLNVTTDIDTLNSGTIVNDIKGTTNIEEINSSSIIDFSKQGLVLACNFNNESIEGNIIFDSSSHNHHGTNINSAYNEIGGLSGSGVFEMNGNTDIIEYGNIVNYNYTYSAWFKSTGVGDSVQPIFEFATGSNKRYIALATDSITLRTTSASYAFDYGSGLNDNEWHHISVYLSTNLSNAVVYVDGVLESPTGSTDYSSAGVTPDAFYVGGKTAGYFNGSIDNVYVYNRLISEIDVQAMYNQKAEPSNSFVSQKDIKVNTTAIYPQNDFVMNGYNMTWYSADGTIGCCGMNNDLSFSCSAGAC